MSKKQRSVEQSHFTNICSLCQDEHKDAEMCACEKWFCKECLLIECSSQLQDEPRAKACTFCGISTLCSLCSIAAFYQGCAICKQEEGMVYLQYLNVCPQCISKKEALSLIPDSEIAYLKDQTQNTFYHLFENEEGDEIISAFHADFSTCSSSISASLNDSHPKLAWYCPLHRPIQNAKSDFMTEIPVTTPPFSDYESECFDISEEEIPDWSDFCIMPNIIHLSQEYLTSPSSSPTF